MEYLLARPNGFHVYCDHNNLIRIFAPSQEVPKHIRGKRQRWAAILTPFNFTIHHIDGSCNLWADMLSRMHSTLAEPPCTVTMDLKIMRSSRGNVLRPLQDDSFVWPNSLDIQNSQSRFIAQRPILSTIRDDIVLVDGLVWIPEEDEELIARILVISHCGLHGHRGKETILSNIQSYFQIGRLNEKVADFINRCLLCKHVRGGKLI